MDIKYLDGKWHDWKGGKRPIPASTYIEVEYKFSGPIDACTSWANRGEAYADWFHPRCWTHKDCRQDDPNSANPIIRFRVVELPL